MTRLPAALRLLGLALLGIVALGSRAAEPEAAPLHEDAVAMLDLGEEQSTPVVEAASPPCDGGEEALPDAIRDVAHRLAAQHIVYGRSPMSDCSGMFHRVIGMLGARCEGLLTPAPEVARSSAAIAHWYDRRGLLVRVTRPEDADPYLVPRALVFFAHSQKAGAAVDLDRVMHVGVVVDVTRDAAGLVQGYAIFHARQPGTTAGITRWHARDLRPSLGNGSDPLVAIGFMEPALAEDGIAAAFDEAELDAVDAF